MKFDLIRRSIGSTLLLALALAACTPAGTAGPAPTPAPTAQQATTSAPAPTAAPTERPIPTAEPTAAPAATAAPTAAPVAGLILPNDVPWVRSSGKIFADDETFDFHERGLPAPAYWIKAAPDGTYIAYISQEDRLVVIDMRTGKQVAPETGEIQAAGFVFSPESRALAFRVVDGPLEVLDLASGTRRTLAESAPQPAPGELGTVLIPISWTRDGLLAERILWASDAPPHGLALIDPASGAATPIRKQDHISAIVSPDGKRIALVIGSMPIAGTPMVAIAVVDIASGSETTLVPEQQMVVKALRWSQDGSKLLYASAAGYPSETSVTALHVMNADGSNAQVVEVGGEGIIPSFRDIAWRDDSTPLLLSAEAGDRLKLYALPVASFDITGLQPLMGIARQPDERGRDQILHVPS